MLLWIYISHTLKSLTGVNVAPTLIPTGRSKNISMYKSCEKAKLLHEPGSSTDQQ